MAKRADVVGYRMGGGIALQLAIRHPELVRKLVVASASFSSDGMPARVAGHVPGDLAGAPCRIAGRAEYLRLRLEHAVEMFRLRGGGVMGDLAGMPASRLAVLPGTSHSVPPRHGLLDRADWLLAMIPPFLDALPRPGDD